MALEQNSLGRLEWQNAANILTCSSVCKQAIASPTGYRADTDAAKNAAKCLDAALTTAQKAERRLTPAPGDYCRLLADAFDGDDQIN
jgi:hypothetical protein